MGDNYPDDQSWHIIQRRDGLHLHTSPVYTKAQSLTETIVYLPYALDKNDPNEDCHDFIISDVYGDGICCGQGRGYYTVSRILGMVTNSKSLPVDTVSIRITLTKKVILSVSDRIRMVAVIAITMAVVIATATAVMRMPPLRLPPHRRTCREDT